MTVINSGNATLAAAGTRQQLVTTPTPCSKVIITTGSSNGGNIAIGGANVVGSGAPVVGAFILPLGSIELDIDDLSKIRFDGTTTGDTVTYTYLA